jgi:carbon-monoxide dehydrogenase medium subunit
METVANGQALISGGAEDLQPFRLSRPGSVSEAMEIHRDSGEEAVWAHGTTDLVAQFREGLRPDMVISLRRVSELEQVVLEAGELAIGAGVTHQQASSHPLVNEGAGDLARHWARIANPRVRFRATLAGNLMARRNRYELALLLGAVGGVAEFADPSGSLEISVPDIWDEAPSGALLTRVRVSTDIAMEYHRELRPLLTVAVGRPRDQELIVAVGMATAAPWFHHVDAAGTTPPDVAEEVAAALPADRSFDRDRGVSQRILAHLVQQVVTPMLGGR